MAGANLPLLPIAALLLIFLLILLFLLDLACYRLRQRGSVQFLNTPLFPLLKPNCSPLPRRDPPVVSESASVQEAGRTQCESGAERADRLLVKVRMVLMVLVRMTLNTSREISLLIHTHHDGTVYNAVEQYYQYYAFIFKAKD